MPFVSTRAKLSLTEEDLAWLNLLRISRSESPAQVQRAQMLLQYFQGQTVSAIAAELHTNRPKVERCISKALEFGIRAALRDVPGRGRPQSIAEEDKAWVVSLAGHTPRELGYAQELWTTRLLAQHIQKCCVAAGYPQLRRLGAGTVSKILAAHPVRPRKVPFFLERRHPGFEVKISEALYVCKDVEVWLKAGSPQEVIGVLSHDEKSWTPAGKPSPGPGNDPDYQRRGNLSLLAGIDLLTGEVIGLVRDHYRSAEFIDFLRLAGWHYPEEAKLRVVLENHPVHLSKQTRAYLATVPNRFEFIFTPKHGYWLNLLEAFFGKLTKTFLGGIRASSKADLKARLERFLHELNEESVTSKGTYKLESLEAHSIMPETP